MHKRISELDVELPFASALEFGEDILARVRKIVVCWVVGSWAWRICGWFIESLRRFGVPVLGSRTSEFAGIVFSFRVQLLREIVGSGSWNYPLGGFLVEVFLCYRPHCPSGSVSVAILVVVSWSWELYPIQLNVTPGPCFLPSSIAYFSPQMTRAASVMGDVRVDKGINFIVVRWWGFIVPVLAVV